MQAAAFVDAHFPTTQQGAPVIGVHIRGTDMWVEYASQRVPALEQVVARVQYIVDTTRRAPGHVPTVFVAADSSEAVAALHVKLTGCRVLSTPATRAHKHNGRQWFHPPAANATAVGMQVLLDVLLLSRSSMLVHDHSSVALLAALLNPSVKLVPLQPADADVDENASHQTGHRGRQLLQAAAGPENYNENSRSADACYAANKQHSLCAQIRQSQGVNVRQAVEQMRRVL